MPGMHTIKIARIEVWHVTRTSWHLGECVIGTVGTCHRHCRLMCQMPWLQTGRANCKSSIRRLKHGPYGMLICMKTMISRWQGVDIWPRQILQCSMLCAVLLRWSPAAAQELKVPDRLWECEGRDNATCGTWAFSGREGVGQWSNGARAELVVQQFDPAWIVIRRSDPSGTSLGLTGIYVGRLNGSRIEGTVKWTWLGHWNQQVEGTWYATLDRPSTTPALDAQASAPKIGQEMPPQAPQASEEERRRASPQRIQPVQGGSLSHDKEGQQVAVDVVLSRPWTDTEFYLAKGQSVTVTAHGTMNWYTGACNGKCLSTPAGIPCPGTTS